VGDRKLISSETDLLLHYLNGQRRHLLNMMEGLDDATLMRRMLPSQWSPAALVNHLTHDVERFWFRQVVANEPNGFQLPDGMEEAWWISEDASPRDILDAYRAEGAYSDEIVRARGLDDEPLWWDESMFGPGSRPDNLRDVILHVITETATHAGHMDVVRELIDGKQNMVFTSEPSE
jgi:uncharacterized damage-inducible protein DinB